MNCSYCEERIEEENVLNERMHDECLVRAIVGSAAHQLGDCSCCGGTRCDPPGVSLRDGARLAFDAFLIRRAA